MKLVAVRNRAKRAGLRTSLVAGLCLAAIGCGGTINQHGYVLDPGDVETIAIGLDTRQDVADNMGSPSSISTFEDNRWYYISERTEQFAFFKPEVLERSVIIITFDEAGFVEGTEFLTLEDGQDIDLVARETPTEGRELSIMQELFGNLGRFGSTTPPPPPPIP